MCVPIRIYKQCSPKTSAFFVLGAFSVYGSVNDVLCQFFASVRCG